MVIKVLYWGVKSSLCKMPLEAQTNAKYSTAPLGFETLLQYLGLTNFHEMHHTGGISIAIVIATVTV